MSRTILLDSGPLGLVANPRGSEEAGRCARWLENAEKGGATIIVPEIADYEVRRKLVRAGRVRGIARLDALVSQVEYLAITTAAMRRAAAFWAEARQRGLPTTADAALDGDVILAAQAATLDREDTIVATTNVKHLSRFVPSALWADIA